MAKVLFAGESWLNVVDHVKGFDLFANTTYDESGARRVTEALRTAGHEVDYLPSHAAPRDFPITLAALADYQVVCLSDLSADSLLLHPDTFGKSLPTPNRLKLLREWVLGGGGLLMIGGYFSFQGIYARARWQGTPVEEVLPVTLQSNDDRVEVPESFTPRLTAAHPILEGLPSEWPYFLGYNRLTARPGAAVPLSTETGDPFLALATPGEGRTAAFASDCAPHWGSRAFCEWSAFGRFWAQLVEWLAGAAAQA